MLLRHALGLSDEADAVETAIGGALDAGCRTADLARAGESPLSCTEMTRAIIDRLGSG
jgi:3-isopropylmalate dehydrogenase